MLYVLLAMGLGLAVAAVFDIADPDDPDLVVDQDGDRITGTEGADTVTAAHEGFFSDVEVYAGAGNDFIDLLDADNQRAFWAQESGSSVENSDQPTIEGHIDGGLGDDTINVRVGRNDVHGGDGDDHIFAEGSGSQIFGGVGDDVIETINMAGDTSHAHGGEGNDTVDGAFNQNGTLYGGAGNDLLIGGTGGSPEDGYVSRIVGGEGDDTLRFEVETDFSDAYGYNHQRAEGGAGADRFEVIVDEGDPRSMTGGESDGTYYGGSSSSDPLVIGKNLVLEDFTPGEDTLVLDAAASDPRFSLASVRMAEVELRDGTTETAVTLTYETSDAELRDHIVSFYLAATGVSWDDVGLVGADRSILLPLTA